MWLIKITILLFAAKVFAVDCRSAFIKHRSQCKPKSLTKDRFLGLCSMLPSSYQKGYLPSKARQFFTDKTTTPTSLCCLCSSLLYRDKFLGPDEFTGLSATSLFDLGRNSCSHQANKRHRRGKFRIHVKTCWQIEKIGSSCSSGLPNTGDKAWVPGNPFSKPITIKRLWRANGKNDFTTKLVSPFYGRSR